MHSLVKTFVALAVGATVWIPNLHRFYTPDAKSREHVVRSIEARAMRGDDAQRLNPEWEYMSRTFTVLGLANRALAHPDDTNESAAALVAIDRIIDRTRGEVDDPFRFLLPYARSGSFVDPEARSVFVDGELLMMIAARDFVSPRPELDADARDLENAMERAMRRSPTLSAESYPNEAWTFCNTTALAAMAMFDRTHGGDHSRLAKDWVLRAKSMLLDAKTGLLVSSFTRDGEVHDGPEGSSIWMSATNLLFFDDAFARDQWTRARRELGATAFGFGWAHEWPRGAKNARPDIDSGPIVPMLDASAGSSGFAILGASAFGDDAYRDALIASLDLAAMPHADAPGERRYLASNRVGDAVLFDALTFGPLLERMKR